MSETAAAATHHPGLAHHFESYEQQKQSSFLGMWLFLAQEIMFFGGFFVVYVIYRGMYGDAFAIGSRELSVSIGALNTCVLLLSSFTMVVAVSAAQQGKSKWVVYMLLLTMFFGLVFLGVKIAFEYIPKWDHGLVPGLHWDPHVPYEGRGLPLYFALYFGMTGMHGLHVLVGIGIMAFMLVPAWKGKWHPKNYNFVEGFGLYWHFVDIVWIFIFPFLYLIGLATH